MDGLLFTPCAGMPDEVERLPAMGTPVVVMDREAATTPLNAVTMNNYGSAEKATRLLIASGYRRTPPTATIAAIRWRLEHRLGGFGQPVHSFMTAPFSLNPPTGCWLGRVDLPDRPTAMVGGWVGW